MGVAVQLTVLLSLTEALGLNYLVATVLAVESAILHNFVWHERWTWRDRDTGIHGRWTRLAWFNLVTGALSISTNVVFTALYVSTLGIHYAMANLMAIATCSLLTFVASDRFVFRACLGARDHRALRHRASRAVHAPSPRCRVQPQRVDPHRRAGRRRIDGGAREADRSGSSRPPRSPAGADRQPAAESRRPEPKSPLRQAKRAENRYRAGGGNVMAHALQPTGRSMLPAPLSMLRRVSPRTPGRPASADLTVRAALIAVLLAGATDATAAAELQPQTIAAWDRYVEATERRIAAELEQQRPDRFLVQDFRDDAAGARREVLAGRVRIDELETRDVDGERIPVPKGAIHHWLGSALIPGVTLEEVLHALIYAVEPEALQDDVIESRVLGRPGADRLEVFLKLRRKQMVTVQYNTEHAVAYTRHRAGAASSRSVATRIAELDDAGTPDEREKPIGRDHGLLWRLNSYWRYRQVDEGVIVECESLSLSRSIPRLLRWMASPLINRAARDILSRTLASMAEVLRTRAPAALVEPTARTLQP